MKEKELKERAKHVLRRARSAVTTTEDVDMRSLIEEFEVCQAELEMRHEELEVQRRRLREAVERLEAVCDISPVATVIVGESWTIRDANQAASGTLDRSKESLIGTRLTDYFERDDSLAVNGLLSKARKEGGPLEETVDLRGPVPRSVRLRVAATEYNPPEIVVAMIDLTTEIRHTEELAGEVQGRRRAERALDETRERLATIVQTAVDAILTIDEAGVIESFNPAAETLFGYDAEEVLGERALMLVPETERQFLQRRLVEYQNGDLELGGLDVEIRCQRKDGTAFPASLVVSEMSLGGRRVLTGLVRDLSEKKELEEQLRHAQKMEAIGTLATGVAHDFNNILMGISGCVELASRHIPFGSEAHTHLDDIREASGSGADIAHQLLSFARRQKSRNKRFLVDDVVGRLGRLLKTLVGEDVELEMDLHAPAGWVFADPAQFEQVLMNLAINARDAMADGGVLRIETRTKFEMEPPGECEPGEYVRLTVRDTGCGIPEQLADRVFEPFFTTKKPGRGTGLGLSTVHGIVQAMGGHIDLDSEVGRGTRFEIRIPVTVQSLSEESSTGEFLPANGVIQSGSTTRPPRTLVIEDDRLVRRTVVGYLRRLGHDVVEAATIADALYAADQLDSLDLVISDLVLTDGEGTHGVRQIARSFPEIGIIFMSAHGFDELVEQDRMPPDARFLQKPFSRDDLVPEVYKALKKRAGDMRSRPELHPVILIVDDHAASRLALRASLEEIGYTVIEAGTAAEALRMARESTSLIRVALTDVRLPDKSGPMLARELAEESPSTDFVFMSGLPRELASARYELPRGSMFLEKPFELSLVAEILDELAPLPEY